jgi:hypothetical protein
MHMTRAWRALQVLDMCEGYNECTTCMDLIEQFRMYKGIGDIIMHASLTVCA